MQFLPNKLYLAMNAALFIAYNGDEDVPVSGAAIVDYYNLNKRALEPVLQRLSNAGLIASVKGARGGYYMPDPDQKTLRDVVDTFIERVYPDKRNPTSYDSILNGHLVKCHDEWLAMLSEISFQQLCEQAKTSNIIPLETPVLNFAI